MQIVIIDGTRWRGKGFYLPTLDVAFISDKSQRRSVRAC